MSSRAHVAGVGTIPFSKPGAGPAQPAMAADVARGPA